MNEDLRSTLIKYRDCTLEIIKLLEKDDIDSIDELAQERQSLVDQAIEMKGIKEEYKDINQELKLEELQAKLNILMSNRLKEIKEKSEEISKNRKATNVYGGVNGTAARIFSKKI